MPLQLLLDAAFIAAALAAFGQVWDPDGLFHVIWVILVVDAFLFGFRHVAPRIVAALILLVVYAILGAMSDPAGFHVVALELTEWPLMAAIVAIVAFGADRTEATSRRYASLYRRASDRLLTAQEDERRRLSRDLHDGIGQTLTATSLTIDTAASMLDQAPTATRDSLDQALRRAHELVTTAIDESRAIAYQLRPDRLIETGLVAGAERLASSAGIPVTVVADPDLATPGLLDPKDELNVYRIIQESVANAVRHAHADHVEIRFTTDHGSMSVTIIDDGVGFDPAADSENRGLGIAGMRERAMIIGARFGIRSAPGQGTRVWLTIPLASDEPGTAGATRRPMLKGGAS